MDKINTSFIKLFDYVQKNEFKGWDCFDGLNSKIFQATPLRHNRYMRMAFTQFVKRSPVNFRRLLRIDKDYNPKGLGLFLSGCLEMYKVTNDNRYLDLSLDLISKLQNLKSPGWSGDCWGYNFDWQSRGFFQPKYTPTVVPTYFIAEAFIQAYEILNKQEYLDTAYSACTFILNDLNRTGDDAKFCFSYSPLDRSQVYNATLLAAALLSRIYAYFKENRLIETAQKTIRYCIEHQNPDGSWYYGAAANQKWIDSFHTGYNLMCINEYMEISDDHTCTDNLHTGLKYYKDTFFLDDFTPKYYHDRIYPIDIHSPAQAVITFIKLKNKCDFDVDSFCTNLLEWTIDHMQDKKYGYFYYQKNKNFTSRIPYMRWSQSWMFLALTWYLSYVSGSEQVN